MSDIILPNGNDENKIIKPGDLLFPTIDINQIQQEPNITEKDMGNAGFKDPKAVNDLKYIIKDILSGDPKAAKRPEYTSLGYEQMKTAIKWLEQQGLDDATLQLLLEKPYLLTFKDKPPTPGEFLTSKYIGSQAESVWWPVRKNFLQFFDPLKPYRTAVLNPSIGSGKQQPISSKVYISKNKYKFLKDIQIGDSIYTPFGDYAKVISIQKNGIDKVYKITLSDGRSFRTGYNHFNTVCFRKENNKKVFDTLTTHYIKENLNKYNFEIPSELELLNMRSEDTISLVAEHENEPSDNIIPLKREQNKVYIENIEYIGEEEQWCITLNDPLGLYYTDDKCITHNSTFTMLALLYIACHFALMRDPWKFFGKSRTTVFIIALCAVTQGKAKEIYNEPIRQLIESASFWHWCRTHQEMLNEEKHLQESDTIEYIPWTTAVDASVFATGNGLQWKTASGDGNIIGLNILVGAMTEINFFLEAGKGWTPDKVYRFFSKLKERISNRFQSNYYARFILDSSPSSLDDPIQNWMTYDAPENPSNYIWRGSRWNLYPEEFPSFCDVENLHTLDQKVTEHHNYDVAFRLYKGGSGKPPIVCETESEASQFDNADLIWCPKEQVTKNGTASFLGKAKENPLDFLKDWCGEPSGTPDRLFYRDDWIEDCFDNGLKNLYGSIVALADEQPEHLIWNQIQNQFFYKVMNRYYFYYEPNVPRVVSVDQSKSRDCTCIAMSHVEKDPNRIDEHTRLPMTIYVTDFTIVLVPKGGHINLDAIKFFIYDLKNLGGINLRHVSFDGWQSDPARQFLSRAGINVDYVSVDKLPEPYYTYYDLVTHGRWACGKNIFVKNNMKSLHEVRRKQTGTIKIDHFEGDLDYEWEKGNWQSNVVTGYNAKDTTDAITGNIWLMNLYSNEFIPQKFFYKDAQLERTIENIEKKNAQLLNSLNLV